MPREGAKPMSDMPVDDTDVRTAGDDDHNLVNIRILFQEIIRKQFTIMLRYRVNFLINLVTVYVFFAIIFFGGQAAISSGGASTGSMDSTFDGIIVGWFLWTMAQGAYAGLSQNVTQESEWGTLEQLYMSPYGFGRVMFLKAIANILQSIIVGSLVLVLMLLTTQRTLSVDLITIIPISLLALLSVVGIGFIFAGLTLIYKRIGSVSSLMQFGMIGLIGAPAADIPLLKLLPLVQGSALLQQAMRKGVRLWEFSVIDLGILVGTALLYTGIGYAVFQFCSRVARKRGVMGHY